MSDAPVPVSLDDAGTRFRHLTDLQDHWALGVELKKSMMKRFPTKSDELALAKLEAAVELLKIHIDSLAKKATNIYKIGREVDSIAKIKTTAVKKVEGEEADGRDVGVCQADVENPAVKPDSDPPPAYVC